ncbi:MAG: hypothetical protein ABIQ03_04760 [Burkholderiales bacterium]
MHRGNSGYGAPFTSYTGILVTIFNKAVDRFAALEASGFFTQ